MAAMLVPHLLLGQASWLDPYRAATARIIREATTAGQTTAWSRLAELTDRFPGRLSGSRSLEEAIRWAGDAMTRDGLENVRIDRVIVPHWVRGAESAEIVSSPRNRSLFQR
jgi:carboxypeptidase Q